MSEAKKRIFYQCQRCGACCRWPGLVRIREEEIPRFAAHMGISEEEFIDRYTRLTPQRNGLALIDKPNGECYFLNGRDCMLQAVKPVQCTGFPNTWNFPGWQEVCEAIPVELPEGVESLPSQLGRVDGGSGGHR